MASLPQGAQQTALQRAWLGYVPVQPLSRYPQARAQAQATAQEGRADLRYRLTPPGLSQPAHRGLAGRASNAAAHRHVTTARQSCLPPGLFGGRLGKIPGHMHPVNIDCAASAATGMEAAPSLDNLRLEAEQGSGLHSVAAAAEQVSAAEPRGDAVDELRGREGQLYVPPDPAAQTVGMAVTWLGTSSGAPTKRRNVSSIALRTLQQTLLVDCGEATNRQAAVAGINMLSIHNIFITHMHGDHCFGLPGLLITISDARAGTSLTKRPLRVFGPPGIQDLVASTLSFSGIRLSMPIIVAEYAIYPDRASPPRPVEALPGLSFAVLAPDFTERAKQALKAVKDQKVVARRTDQIMLHEVDVVPGLTWTIPCEPGLTVTAAQLQHRVPCWGYVIKEADTPPSERPERLQRAGLALGAALVALREGGGPNAPVNLPDGTSVPLRELLNPPVPGRKVVLLGDTCNSRAIADVGRDADLLSHEATFSRDMLAKARKAQHSTAEMAGSFARQIGASTLVLTHFSSRYAAMAPMKRGGQPPVSQAIDEASAGDIWGLLDEAKRAFGSNRVFPAQDFFTYDVLNQQQLAAYKDNAARMQPTGPVIEEEEEAQASSTSRQPGQYSRNNQASGPGGRGGSARRGRGASRDTYGRTGGGRGGGSSLRRDTGRGQRREYAMDSAGYAQARRQRARQNGGHQFEELNF